MKINKDNYEAYFLDYHEGQLSPEMVEELLLFVERNPELKSILIEFEPVTLPEAQNIVFEKKSSLKKNQVFATSQVNELNYEEYLINEAEGLLNTEQLSAIEEFISINPQFKKDRRLYALAHLSVDDDIVFEAKESLKKKAIPVGAIDAGSFETYMARDLEGDLNPIEKLQLAEFMQYNPHLENDRKLYSHTILSAEPNILFKNKNSLKRTVVIPFRRVAYYVLSAAASLALIFSVYFLLNRNNVSTDMAQQGKVKTSITQPINEPSTVTPDNQLATNAKKQSSVTPPHENKRNITNTAITNKIEAKNQPQESLALINKHSIEPLKSRSAQEVTTRSFVEPEFTFIRVSQMYINQNRELYYNLKLAQELEYAEMNSKDKNPAKTIFNSFIGKAGDFLAFNRKTPQKEEQNNVSLWTFAELGVKTFNTITSSDLEFNLHKDDEGKVVGYDFEGKLINIDKDLTK